MTYQSYDLSRYIDGDLSQSNSITVSDHDTLNCAHMLAAGFNTMSRKMMGDFVLAVVDTKAGTVQYDGKIEQINRPEPEPSAFAHVARDVLEDAYDEYLLVQAMLSEIGVETIPISAGVDKLREQVAELTKRNNHEFHARSMYEQVEGQKREAARAELIEYVKSAYAKLGRLDAAGERDDLQGRMRGMLDVLAKFLAVTGEADHDERHAAARRLCGIPEGARV